MRTLMLNCQKYLDESTGHYDLRAIRYAAASEVMIDLGLSDQSLVVDVGAGWTELDYQLRTAHHWRGRYYPVDGMLDGTDLNEWVPPRGADFFVCLEVLEHLNRPTRLLNEMIKSVGRAVICSVPNPETTDVFGMDATHRIEVTRGMFERCGFTVSTRCFFGKAADSLFAIYKPMTPME